MATVFSAARFQFIADALNGAGPFIDGSALVQYPRESADKFARRKAIAWYANALRPAVSRFVGYLMKKPVQRELPSPILQQFAEECTWQSDSLSSFWAGFMLEAKARGSMFLLVDMPRNDPLPGQKPRLTPYLVSIEPERVLRYVLNEYGQLKSIAIKDSIQDASGNPQTVERVYTDTEWIFTGAINARGVHDLGVCPVLAFTESGLFPCIGDFAGIADLSKRLYNLRSELDEILRAQTFSLLTYKVPEASFPLDMGPIAQTIGTDNLLQTFPQGAEFIAPPDGPATVYLQVIAQVEALIRQIAMTADDMSQRQGESGVALQLRFQALNGALVQFARRMEDFERKVWDLVALWLGVQNTAAISWGKDFSIADLKLELEIAQNMTALNAPLIYQQEKLKQLIALDLGTLPDDTLAEVLKGVDDMQQEVAPSAVALPEKTVTRQPDGSYSITGAP